MAALEAALSVIDDWPVSGAAAAVVAPTGVLAAHGATEQTFPLASVTKPLAALAILVAVEEGAIGLDEPADEQLLPGATLRHLLAHASGVAFDARLRLFRPATRRVYSNIGIEMAASLVERATRMPFASYLYQAVIQQLGLRKTELLGSAAAGGVSTVADLAEVAYELITPSGMLAWATLAEATTVHYPGLRGVLPGFGHQNPNDWGLGFEIRDDKSPHWTGTGNSPQTYGHFGQSGTMLWIDPVARLGLVVLTDRDFGDWSRQAWPALSDGVLAAARA
jgi:CubicO group peptidase (beta-lactamase class C family)